MFGKDKAKHFLVGFCLSVVVTTSALVLGWHPLLGFASSTFVGMLKELKDSKGPGHEEFMDFYVTMLGGLPPSLVLPLFM